MRELGLDAGHALGRHVDVVGSVAGIVGRHAGLRLHRIAGDALRAQLDAHDVARTGESRIGGRAVAVLVFHRDVSGHVGVNRGRRCRERVLGLGHSRQVSIVDGDLLCRVLRRPFAVRHHERDRLADEPDPPLRERRAMRDSDDRAFPGLEIRHRPRALEAGLRQVLAAKHAEHARHLRCRFGVEAYDLRVCAIGAQEISIDLARQVPVCRVLPLPRNQTKVLAPAVERPAHQNSPPCRFDERRGERHYRGPPPTSASIQERRAAKESEHYDSK